MNKCPVCGCEYIDERDYLCEEHMFLHNTAIESRMKYGFWYAYSDREKIKLREKRILRDPEAKLLERFNALILIFQVYFSRSLARYGVKDHPTFNQYAANLLSLGPTECLNLRLENADKLWEKAISYYGTKKTVKNGRVLKGGSYWYPLEEIKRYNLAETK